MWRMDKYLLRRVQNPSLTFFSNNSCVMDVGTTEKTKLNYFITKMRTWDDETCFKSSWCVRYARPCRSIATFENKVYTFPSYKKLICIGKRTADFNFCVLLKITHTPALLLPLLAKVSSTKRAPSETIFCVQKRLARKLKYNI